MTGLDPEGSYLHFVKGDVINNIDVHRAAPSIVDLRSSLADMRVKV